MVRALLLDETLSRVVLVRPTQLGKTPFLSYR